MSDELSKESAVDAAVRDAATRAGVAASDVKVGEVEDSLFPDGALGAPREGEVSFSMMTPGWTILVTAGTRSLEYRADSRQVRLVGFEGQNHLISPG